MRKLLVGILCTTMLFTFTACGESAGQIFTSTSEDTNNTQDMSNAKSVQEYLRNNYEAINKKLCEMYNKDNLEYKISPNSDINALNAFGAGCLYFTVDGVPFSADITKDRIYLSYFVHDANRPPEENDIRSVNVHFNSNFVDEALNSVNEEMQNLPG